MTNRAEIVITAMDKASAVINRIADRMDVLGEKSNLRNAFSRLANTAGLEKINTALGRIAGNAMSVAKYGGIAAGAIGAGFALSLNSIDDFADAMANAGVEGRQLVEMSAMRDYFSQFNISSQDASTSLLKLTSKMSEARAGNEQMQQAFAAAGVSMEDLKTKSPVDVLKKMMDVFSQSDKSGAKLKVLETLAGESAAKMSKALSQGTQAFEEYKEKNKNALLTEEDFEGAKKGADAINDISLLVTRTVGKMAAAAGPQIKAILDRGESKLLDLIPRLVSWVDRFVNALNSDRVTRFFEGVASVFGAVASAVGWLIDNVNTTLLVIGALGIVFAPTIAAMTSIGTVVVPLLIGAFKSLGVALMMNPIFLAIGLLAGAAYMIYRNWDGIMGGLKALWEDLGSAVSAVFTGMYDGFVAAWDGIGAWFSQKIGAITSMLPDWMTGGSLDVNVNSPSVQTSAQTIVQGGGRTEVGGRIRIELAGAPAKVTQLSTNNQAVPIDVAAGLYGVG